MITIILSACMVADPNVCKDYRLPLDGDMSTQQCAMAAPPYFAQWAEDHPAWQIKRWKCVPSGLDDT